MPPSSTRASKRHISRPEPSGRLRRTVAARRQIPPAAFSGALPADEAFLPPATENPGLPSCSDTTIECTTLPPAPIGRDRAPVASRFTIVRATDRPSHTEATDRGIGSVTGGGSAPEGSARCVRHLPARAGGIHNASQWRYDNSLLDGVSAGPEDCRRLRAELDRCVRRQRHRPARQPRRTSA